MVLFMLTTLVGLGVGLLRGNAFFRQADVSHLLVSPVKPRNILFYGLFRQVGLYVFFTLLLAVQLGNLHFYFNLQGWELALLLGVWILLCITLILLSMGVYSLTAIHPAFRMVIRLSMYIFSAIVIVGLVITLWKSQSPLSGTLKYFDDPHMHALPLGGWAMGLLVSVTERRYELAAVYGGLLVLFAFIGFIFSFRNHHGFYEDILISMEHGCGALRDSQEEDKAGAKAAPVKKSHLMGVSRGEAALMLRQMTECKKRPLFFLDWGTLAMLLLSVALGAIMRALMLKGMYEFIMEIISLSALCYAMLFSVRIETFLDELKKPYIFLVPGSTVKKLLYFCATPYLKALLEGALCTTIVSVFARLRPAFVFYGTLFYGSAAILFCAAYVASVRALGLNRSRFLYKLLAFAIVTAIFLFELSFGTTVGSTLYMASTSIFLMDFLILAICNLIASLIFFFSARTILETRD